ncbi:MAG: DUF4097 family beta strand repeat protein [Clostridia bacterium]|nr:DUF4097 family beta strand repeat protein [Clostridia bacterium]
MSGSKNTMRNICIALGAVVAVLVIVIAFLLGKQAGANKNDGAGRTSSDITTAVGETAWQGSLTDTEDTAADAANSGETAQTPAAQPSEAATQVPATVAPAQPAVQAEGMPRTLDINMTNGSLTFEKGSRFDVKYDPSVIRVDRNGDSMTIANDHSNPSAAERKRMDVVVTVPEGYAFSDLDISFGAGKLISRTLPAETLSLELGAGSATLENVNVTGSATVKSGAGAFAIKSGSIANLNLQCGAGATQVAAALTGASKIVAAVGAADLQLGGSESDYTVTFKMSLGACYYNDTKIARGGSFGTGPNTVDITGGLGVMRVTVG